MVVMELLFMQDVDLKDPKIQRSLVNLDNDVREIDIIDPSSDHMFCWLKRFRRFLSRKFNKYFDIFFNQMFFD